ncbi:uncharacterized protein LOC26536261 isoform X11 [Drosophila yakuba]|uniref:uncharacterized protein LOC26536261 isoform X11 n=1 Tax=Drosophila yakuba TaxID=7245 RepID=UPI00193089A3|nr:uncharacterized protein LOC26536261 isoform X11 [Drosophila yakuba]
MLERILLLKKAIYQFVYTMSIGRKVGYADMTAMSEIDEIGINQNLNVRYNSDIIYTYTGSILLAVNPYKSINIYNTPTLQTPLKQQPATQPVGQPQDSFQPQNFVPIALQQLVAFYPNSPAPPPSIAIRPEGDERASGCFFTLLESQFASLRITVDKIKFHQTLNFLPAEYLETIMYILRNPPTGSSHSCFGRWSLKRASRLYCCAGCANWPGTALEKTPRKPCGLSGYPRA